MAQSKRTLGDVGSNLLTEMSRQRKKLFTFEDAARVYGTNSGGLRELLSTLVKRRWLQRIEKGKYLLLPFEAGREGEWTEHEFIIASCLIEPYYIGFRSALNYYGYTEQVSRTVFIMSTRRKLKSTLEVSGVTYRFVHTDERKFFGFTEVILDGYRINISDREKTIVDCLGQMEYCGGISEVAKALSYGRGELDFAKMVEYSQRNGTKAVSKRLGYLLETLNLGNDADISALREDLGSSYTLLDTLADRKGRHFQRWQLVVNIPDNELLQWKEG
jgi:predicted transcriptional regulator of viral defense system